MTQRDRIVVGVLALAGLMAAFYLVGLKPKRAKSAELDTQIAAEVKKRDEAMARVAQGEQARARFRVDYATIAKLGKAVPVDDQVPSLLYELESTAERHDIDFRTMKLNAQGSSTAPAAASPTPTADKDAKGSAPATQAAAAVAPPGSAVGPAGFPTLPFSFNFDGNFFRMERFLSAIEKYTGTTGSAGTVEVNGRLLTVDAILLTAGREGFPSVKATVSATAYMLPSDEGLTAGASASGPSAAGTAGAPGAGQAPASGGSSAAPTTATVRGVTP